MLTRRQLLQRGAIGGAGLVAGRAAFAMARPAVVGATPRLRKWVEPLPVPPVLDGRGGGKSFTIGGARVDVLEVPPAPSGHEDLGLLVR